MEPEKLQPTTGGQGLAPTSDKFGLLPRRQVCLRADDINAPNWTDQYKQYVGSLSPKTDYRTIEGTGHWLMLEKPADFNAALIDLLRMFKLIEN
jgi:hypothetical protein